MPIPRPPFILVDDCPPWCTMDHRRIDSDPGEHESDLARSRVGDVALYVDAHDFGVDVCVKAADPVRLPIETARADLLELARTLLTAAHRLDIIEAAADAVDAVDAVEDSGNRVECRVEVDATRLLALEEATRLLSPELRRQS